MILFQSPDSANTTYYRLKERQGVSITFNFLREPHYSDAGVKANDPSGYNHTFNMRLKVTADLFDDTWQNTDPSTSDQAWQTLSYWIAKSNANDCIRSKYLWTNNLWSRWN